ncbi:interferon alpha-inducible protein 27-like protein 2B, partial [Asterias rubens]|uniref:interferon alpha-inducible protein 27-like protein 2B n=1 Tax=Asterias rubens TaxID=7604 RepID=UPI001455A186
LPSSLLRSFRVSYRKNLGLGYRKNLKEVSFENGSSLQLSLDDFSQRDTSLKADLKAINFVKQFAKEFSGQLPAEEQPKTKKSGYGVRHVVAGCVVGVGAVAAAPFVLTAVGFTSGGIAAGSIASGMMSSAAIANGGAVAAGSGVAVLQSVGAAGLGAAGTAAVGGAGAAAGAGASGVAGFFQNYFRGRGDSTTENKTSNTTQEDDDYDNNGDGEDGDGCANARSYTGSDFN